MNIMPIIRTAFTILALVVFCVSASAQQPASQVYAGATFSFAERLGYNGVGKGGAFGGGFKLPAGFYATEDIEVVAERKQGFHDGRTVISVTGLQRHFDGGLFARAAISIGNHKNEAFTKTATRAQIGGGCQLLDKTSGIPMLEVGIDLVAPLSDPNNVWGFKTRIKGSYSIPHSAAFVYGKWSPAIVNARETSTPRRSWVGYNSFEFGVGLNLSAIAGY